jgi:hypothetical protein
MRVVRGGWRGVVDRGLQNRYHVVHGAHAPLAPLASALVSVVRRLYTC